MSSFTTYMDLELCDVASDYAIGTLSQDWALVINSNIVKLDAHDHALSGKQILSSNVLSVQEVDIEGVSVCSLAALSLGQNSSSFPRSLFSDGTDLFYSDDNSTVTQITKNGNVNATVIGGFFGDYASTQARAYIDPPNKLFGFLGVGPLNLDNCTLICENADFNAFGATNLKIVTVPSGSVVTPPGTLNIVNSSYIGRGVVTTKGSGTNDLEISNVVGDGSGYKSGVNNVPITDPNGVFHLTESGGGLFLNPNIHLSQTVTLDNRATVFVEIFGDVGSVALSESERFFMPRESKTFEIPHDFLTMATIPHWDGEFSVHMCRWAFIFSDSQFANFNPVYKSLLCQIESVSYVGDTNNPRRFKVRGTVTNIDDVSHTLPVNSFIQCYLRIAAIFPKFNGQGVFFGAEY